MPVKARLEGAILRLVSTGSYTWSDVESATRKAMKQNGFVAGRTVLLFDSRGSEEARTADELRDIASDLSELARPFAATLIVTADDLRFGLARMLAAYAEHLGTELLVFRSMDAAERWVRSYTERPPK